jgi:hypothetical protein
LALAIVGAYDDRIASGRTLQYPTAQPFEAGRPSLRFE